MPKTLEQEWERLWGCIAALDVSKELGPALPFFERQMRRAFFCGAVTMMNQTKELMHLGDEDYAVEWLGKWEMEILGFFDQLASEAE